jgi:dienelactone hydrolase
MRAIGEQLMDAPCGVLISGCPPGSSVEVTYRTAVSGAVHEGSARFLADADGTVDTTSQESVEGSYLGIDPFGLWWSAAPVGQASATTVSTPVESTVEARVGEMSVIGSVTRHWLGDGATMQVIDENGVRGMFCRPRGAGPFPGVIAFGGSGGGLGPAAAWAPVLASRGLAVLAVSYFGTPGLPAALVDIEIEVAERAAKWLLARSDVAGTTVNAIGQSRGSELALLAGALLPEVHAVVGIAPSGISWAGLDAGGPCDRPAWTFRGKPLPYLPIGDEAKIRHTSQATGGPVALRPAFDRALRHLPVDHDAVIPVEQIGGPVLLISGRDDTMWPSTPMSEIAERRAAFTGSRAVLHLSYEDAGHMVAGVPGLPVVIDSHHPLTGGHYSFGGTRAGNARSRSDSWPTIVTHLHSMTR